VDLNLLVRLRRPSRRAQWTRAADRLCVGQSAMSSTSPACRRLFDDPLLVREGRTLVPTAYAESLVKPVREVLDGVRVHPGHPDRVRPPQGRALVHG